MANDDKKFVINCSRRLGKCLAEGTEVLTPNGPKQIQDLRPGDTVYGYNKDGSVSPAPVVAVEYQGEKEVTELLSMSKVIAASTPEHRWMTVAYGCPGEKERTTEGLHKGSRIRREFVQIPCGIVSEPHAYAIGALLGDGCSRQSGFRLYISSQDKEIPEKVGRILQAPHVYKNHATNYTWTISHEPKGVGKGSKGFKNSAPVICNYYEDWIEGRYAHEKTLDWKVVDTWDRESCLQLLAGLIDTDGCVSGSTTRVNLQFCGQAFDVVEGFQKLIWKLFQFKPTIGVERRDKYVNGPIYYINIGNTAVVRQILSEMGSRIVCERKQYKPEYEDLRLTNYRKESVGVKKGDTYTTRCWDIQVGNETNLYLLANGLVTHNSFLMCIIALEHAIKNPHSQIKMAAPTQKSITRIIAPIMRQILSDCPKELQPRYKLHDSTWVFPNGSQIEMAGSEQNQADRLRGTSCNFFVCDEAGFCSDLSYLIESIIAPQMLTIPNARIILASTPPVTPDHDFVRKYMARAMQQGAYLHRTIYDNPMIDAKTIEEYKFEAGGENSTTWRREYLAEVVTETDDALFPEASVDEIMTEIVADIRRPIHYLPFTAMDLGYLDYTGVVFGYYHFPAGKIVIEDELLVNKMTSAQIVELVLAKEKELWGENTPRSRVVDGNSLAIADMNETHRFNCRVPDKSDLAANINRVRMDLMSRALVVNPRCTNLIAQLQFSTWDKSRTKFSRSSDGGHWDLIAALIYWCKHVDRISNPMPADFGFSIYDDWGFPREHKNTVSEQIKSLFPFIIPTRKKRR